MHKHTLLYIISIFILTNVTIGQTIEFGQGVKLKNRNTYSQIMGSNESGTYLIRSKDNAFSKDVILEKYNAKLNLELSKEFELSIPADILKFFMINQNIYAFIAAKNNNTKNLDFLVQKFDLGANQLGGMILLASVEEELISAKSDIGVRLSNNKKYFTLSLLSRDKDSKEKSVFYLHGFDLELNKIYSKTSSINFPLGDIESSSRENDNEGNFFVILDFPKSYNNKRKTEMRNFVLYSYYKTKDELLTHEINKPNTTDVNENSVSSSDYYIDDVGFCINNVKKQLCITGFYGSEKENMVKGFFLQSIDLSNNQVLQNVINSSSLETLREQLSFSKTMDLNDLYIRKIIARSDGGCFMIAEKYFLTRQSYTYYINGFPQTNTRTVYNYNDVMLLSINPDGSLQQGSVIKKEQQSVSDGGYYSSVSNFINNDAIYTLYNADVNQEGDLQMSKFDVLGKNENKILVKAINASLLMIPAESKQISANSFLACTIRDKRFTLMRVTF